MRFEDIRKDVGDGFEKYFDLPVASSLDGFHRSL